jgi:hypothetical protein
MVIWKWSDLLKRDKRFSFFLCVSDLSTQFNSNSTAVWPGCNKEKRSNHKARTVPPLRPKKKKKDKKIKTPSSRKPCPPAPARKTIHICGVSRMFVVSFDPQDPGENNNAENIQHQFKHLAERPGYGKRSGVRQESVPSLIVCACMMPVT